MLLGQLLQYSDIGRIAALGFLDDRQSQFFKQNHRKLFWGIDIKLLPGYGMNFLYMIFDFSFYDRGKILQMLLIQFHSMDFHLCQDF